MFSQLWLMEMWLSVIWMVWTHDQFSIWILLFLLMSLQPMGSLRVTEALPISCLHPGSCWCHRLKSEMTDWSQDLPGGGRPPSASVWAQPAGLWRSAVAPGPAVWTCPEIAKQTPDIGQHCFLRRVLFAVSCALGWQRQCHGGQPVCTRDTERETVQTLTVWAVPAPDFMRRVNANMYLTD